jgi:hypothetical protein
VAKEPGETPVTSVGYPERLDGESDKAYLRRVMASLPTPSSLPEHPEDYFECSEATMLPLDALRTTKSVRENAAASANAAKAMAAAKAGIVAKRQPLKVRSTGDGRFSIIDGNATFTAGVTYGWASIPVSIESGPVAPVSPRRE